MTSERLAVGLAGLADTCFIQHVQRSSISLGQIAQGTAPDGKAALIVQLCRDRRKIAIRAVQVTT